MTLSSYQCTGKIQISTRTFIQGFLEFKNDCNGNAKDMFKVKIMFIFLCHSGVFSGEDHDYQEFY